MKIFGSSLSPFVRKVLAFINEKGLSAEHLPIGIRDATPEFLAASPVRKIPALVDGDVRLADSSAICHYLERKHPTPALFPSGAEDFGRTVWFDEFADTVLVAAAGKVFFNLVVRPNVLKQEPDMAVVEKALSEELPPLFDYLEGQVNGPYLVGGGLTLADLAVASPFVNLKIARHPLDAGRWPKLATYVNDVLARPSIRSISDQRKAA